MKLINYTLLYMSIALVVIVGIWATIFYVNMLDEIYDSIDDGLDNYKTLIIQKAQTDTSVLYKKEFGEGNYAVKKVSAKNALSARDTYTDTLLYMNNEEDFEPVRLLTTTFSLSGNRYYELKVISSMVEEDDLIEDLFYAVLWLYLVLMLSVLLINHVVLKKIWEPFYQLIENLQVFKLSKDKIPHAIQTSVKEFKLLNETVIDLLSRNIETYNSQKQFIENAAHELQTPLAISINKLELLSESAELSEEQAHAIGQVVQSLERLTRLNKSLLLLSKIENKQFIEEEEVNFNVLFKHLMDDFADFSHFKTVKLICREEGVCIQKMNKDLAEILVMNLLKNAIVHNVAEGLVDITIFSSAFVISNTGVSKALNREKLFTRFYKDSTEKGTTGLGLSIVKAILDLYRARINYTFSGQHVMKISFE